MNNLTQAAQAIVDRWDSPLWDWRKEGPTADLIASLRKALEQQAEPASCFCHDGVSLQMVSGGAAPEGYLGKVTLLIDGEYVDYVKAQPEQQAEPVTREGFNVWWDGDYADSDNRFEKDSAAYWAWAGWQAAQRQWVGLTVTTILNMMPSTIPAEYDGPLMEFARDVEAKLKERNT